MIKKGLDNFITKRLELKPAIYVYEIIRAENKFTYILDCEAGQNICK